MSTATSNQRGTSAKGLPPPAFDPERPMLVQPWREFEGRGWLEVHYLGGSITRTVKCKLLDPVLSAEEKLGGSEVFLGPQAAKERIISAGLWAPNKKGAKKSGGDKLPELPKKSICSKDFEGSDEALLARARSVATTIGERTAAGRIGSMGLTRQGKSTFSAWWDGAGADRKARLLSDKKHFDSLTAAERGRLNRVLSDCPFRGEEPVPAPEEEEGEGAEAPGPSVPTPAQQAKPTPKKKGKGKQVARPN